MSTLKKPDLTDTKLRAKLAKGMGHNYYGEPAWPNDLLYMFAVVILGTIACVVGLAVLDPPFLGDKANPYATPLEILPEWYLYPVFQILRVVPNKLPGIDLQTLIPLGLMILPFIENVNILANPFRRPVAMALFLFGTVLTMYLGIGACLPIDKSSFSIASTTELSSDIISATVPASPMGASIETVSACCSALY